MSKLHVICHHHQFLMIINPSKGFCDCYQFFPYPKEISFVNTQLNFLLPIENFLSSISVETIQIKNEELKLNPLTCVS